ncbi:MAG: helix-turn-helix transcriptional regulator [Rhodobacteraceae bacterium]|nr:helix-turn-helix transcriptional regulator [Paracoccaceae bacterium]
MSTQSRTAKTADNSEIDVEFVPVLAVEEVAQGFAALGSEARLEVLMCLVRAGTSGLLVGQIQARTQIPASTLAHHLRFLAQGGLIIQEKQGRSVVNRAAFAHLEMLGDYLLKECCADERCEAPVCCPDEENET